MSDHLVTKYVKLTDTIAVPEEWPVHGLQKFLVPLIEEVIKASNAGKAVVLQILNQPAMLVQRQNRHGIQYFFDKVFTEELIGSYIIDVIFDTNHKNIHTMDRFSLDDYTVKVCQSEYRTAYYLIPVAQCVPMKLTQCQDRQKESNERTNSDLTFLLAIVGIPSWTCLHKFNRALQACLRQCVHSISVEYRALILCKLILKLKLFSTGTIMAPKKLYYAIQFLRSPYWMTDKFTVVPSTWIFCHESQTMVSYPMLEKKELSRHINKRKSPCKTWQIFPVTVEYKANVYDDAVLYIKFRQEMRSSYISSIPQQFAEGIQFVDVQSSTLTSAIPSNSAEDSSTVTTSEISTKAIKDELIARISNRMSEIDKLLDQYIEIQCKCLN